VHFGPRASTRHFTYLYGATTAALEAIYQLSDPVDKPIGSALYGEVRGGDRFAELEAKLILEKDVGPWIFAYNATLEAEWEGQGLREKAGEFNQALGVSRQLGRRFYAGAEFVHEVALPTGTEQPVRLSLQAPTSGYGSAVGGLP
jgi:hypothetical protein